MYNMIFWQSTRWALEEHFWCRSSYREPLVDGSFKNVIKIFLPYIRLLRDCHNQDFEFRPHCLHSSCHDSAKKCKQNLKFWIVKKVNFLSCWYQILFPTQDHWKPKEVRNRYTFQLLSKCFKDYFDHSTIYFCVLNLTLISKCEFFLMLVLLRKISFWPPSIFYISINRYIYFTDYNYLLAKIK